MYDKALKQQKKHIYFGEGEKKSVKQTTNFLMNLIMSYGFSCQFSMC